MRCITTYVSIWHLKNGYRKSCWSEIMLEIMTDHRFFFIVTKTRIAFNIENFTFSANNMDKWPLLIARWATRSLFYCTQFPLYWANMWINALYYYMNFIYDYAHSCQYCTAYSTKLHITIALQNFRTTTFYPISLF